MRVCARSRMPSFCIRSMFSEYPRSSHPLVVRFRHHKRGHGLHGASAWVWDPFSPPPPYLLFPVVGTGSRVAARGQQQLWCGLGRQHGSWVGDGWRGSWRLAWTS